MNRFHQIVSKKWCFLFFNVGTTIYMVVGGYLHRSFDSIFGFIVALCLMNGIALISSRHFPDWK